jgi:signal transduction histidine kinase
MTPRWRKLVLTAHVVFSVGWLGAVVTFLGVAVIGMTSPDIPTVKAAYLVMEALVWAVIVPFNVASLLSGLVSALGTTWGLFRHYWVLFKLVLNLVTTAILLLYTQEIGYFSSVAARTTLTDVDLAELSGPTNVVHSAVALLVLLAATVLAVYKPRGLTRYGQRKQRELRARTAHSHTGA